MPRPEPRASLSVRDLLIASIFLAGSLTLLAVWWYQKNSVTTEAHVALEVAQANAEFDRNEIAAARKRLENLPQSLTLRPALALKLAQLWLNLEDDARAAALLKPLEAQPDTAPQAQLLEGLIALRKHRARDAQRHFERAVTLRPTLITAWERLSQLFMTEIRGHSLRLAIQGLSRCRPLDLEELVVYSSAYEMYYAPDARLPAVKDYLAADPDDAASLVAAVRYLLAKDATDEARALLARHASLRHVPEVMAVESELLLRSDANAALASLGGWTGSTPATSSSDDPMFPEQPGLKDRTRGLAELAVGNWEQGAWSLRAALAVQPIDVQGFYKLGLAFERLHQTAAAEAALRIARRTERLNDLVYRIRRSVSLPPEKLAPLVGDTARLLGELGRYDEGLRWMQLLQGTDADLQAIEAISREIRLTREQGTAPSLADWKFIQALSLTAPAAVPSLPEVGPSHPAAVEHDVATFDEPTFAEQTGPSRIDFRYLSGGIGKKWLLESLGGGAACFDYDNDGLVDLYFCQGGTLVEGQFSIDTPDGPGDKLYRNRGDGTFEDVTIAARLGDTRFSLGSTAGDYDNDGDADLLVMNFGRNAMYVNNGDGTFTQRDDWLGDDGERWHTSAALADLDLDGDLDLFCTTYVAEAYKICRRADGSFSSCSPGNYPAEFDVLLINRGDGTFEDRSDEAGLHVPDGKGLGVVVAELTGDERPDIYVTNDGTPNFLYRNDGVDADGHLKFTEIGLGAGCAVNAAGVAQAGMGIAAADFDFDGRTDLYTTNFFDEGSTLFVNRGDGFFDDVTASSGLLEPTRKLLGFGVQSGSFAGTSRLQIVIANGHIDDFKSPDEPWKMRPQVVATNAEGHWKDVSSTAGNYFLAEVLGRAVVHGDLNGDRQPDVVVTHLDRPAAVLINKTPPSSKFRMVAFDLIGTRSNRDGRGCRLQIVTNGQPARNLELSSGDGYLACNERRQLVAVPESGHTVIHVAWPSGSHSEAELSGDATHLWIVEPLTTDK